MDRRPRAPGADQAAEDSNVRAERLGLVESVSRAKTDDQRLDEMESTLPTDNRTAPSTNPRDGAPPAKNVRP